MSHDHGKFVWFELLTRDVDKAKAFYTETMGWKVEAMVMPGGMEYPLIKVGDAGVGGFMTPPHEQGPSHWVSYVSVADVDATAKKVTKAGGKILADAFDVEGVGRIQVVADPQGGAFALFRAAGDDPPGAKGLGSFHWNELWTSDAKAAVSFYETVLGYSHEVMDMPNGQYFVLKQGDQMRGGLMNSPKEGVPTMWLQYIHVDNCDAAVKRAEQNGAKVQVPAMDVPNVGRFAIVQDPVGAVIGLITPAS